LLLISLCLPPLSAAETLWHVLAKGETLYGVARTYGVSPEALEFANGIDDPAKLKIGQRLAIPSMHRVEKGETLFGIAKAAGTSVAELRKANRLAADAVIKPGDLLFLPLGAAPPTSLPTTVGTVTAGASAATVGAATAGTATVGTATTGTATVGAAKPAESPITTATTASTLTAGRTVGAKVVLPCAGEARYLDGKLFGIAIKAAEGSSVKAVASGTVVSAGPYRGFGSVAFVQSRNGLIFVYGGNASLEVRVGDVVRPGAQVGKVGRDPLADSAEAYFFVFKGSEALDPALAARE
jgi:murein DD-endopeptidase MepM/ murein hydrolase activator NlpD